MQSKTPEATNYRPRPEKNLLGREKSCLLSQNRRQHSCGLLISSSLPLTARIIKSLFSHFSIDKKKSRYLGKQENVSFSKQKICYPIRKLYGRKEILALCSSILLFSLCFIITGSGRAIFEFHASCQQKFFFHPQMSGRARGGKMEKCGKPTEHCEERKTMLIDLENILGGNLIDDGQGRKNGKKNFFLSFRLNISHQGLLVVSPLSNPISKSIKMICLLLFPPPRFPWPPS